MLWVAQRLGAESGVQAAMMRQTEREAKSSKKDARAAPTLLLAQPAEAMTVTE